MSIYTELGIHQISEADVFGFINTVLCSHKDLP